MLIDSKYRCIRCFNELESEDARCKCGCLESEYKCAPHWITPGTFLENRYCIGRVIGEGGFGITYVGYDIRLDIKLAIKEFFLSGINTRNSTYSCALSTSVGNTQKLFEVQRDKFINEARILAKLNKEDGIVSVYDYVTENNTAYIIMELIEGKNLSEYITQKERLSLHETIEIFMPIMKTLHKVHNQGLIHRDISPDNIICTYDGKTKLIDFGAARETNHENKSLSVVLKHGYAPMEQYSKHGDQGAWTDVYALCATMYKCVTGKTPVEVTERALGEELVPPSSIVNDIPQEFSDIIMKGLEINIDNRYKDVYELLCEISSLEEKKEEVKNDSENNDIVVEKEIKREFERELKRDKQSLYPRKIKKSLVIALVSSVICVFILLFARNNLFNTNILSDIKNVVTDKNEAALLSSEENSDESVQEYKELLELKLDTDNLIDYSEYSKEKISEEEYQADMYFYKARYEDAIKSYKKCEDSPRIMYKIAEAYFHWKENKWYGMPEKQRESLLKEAANYYIQSARNEYVFSKIVVYETLSSEESYFRFDMKSYMEEILSDSENSIDYWKNQLENDGISCNERWIEIFNWNLRDENGELLLMRGSIECASAIIRELPFLYEQDEETYRLSVNEYLPNELYEELKQEYNIDISDKEKVEELIWQIVDETDINYYTINYMVGIVYELTEYYLREKQYDKLIFTDRFITRAKEYSEYYNDNDYYRIRAIALLLAAADFNNQLPDTISGKCEDYLLFASKQDSNMSNFESILFIKNDTDYYSYYTDTESLGNYSSNNSIIAIAANDQSEWAYSYDSNENNGMIYIYDVTNSELDTWEQVWIKYEDVVGAFYIGKSSVGMVNELKSKQ